MVEFAFIVALVRRAINFRAFVEFQALANFRCRVLFFRMPETCASSASVELKGSAVGFDGATAWKMFPGLVAVASAKCSRTKQTK